MFGFLKPKPRPAEEAAVEAATEAPGESAAPATSWFSRLKEGLTKTRRQLGGRLSGLFGVGRKLDEAFYEELETVLLTSDVGVQATEFLIENLRARAARGLHRSERAA